MNPWNSARHLVIFCCFPLVAGCNPTQYKTLAFEAKVVDAETGEPIEGANVLASWELREETMHGTKFVGIPEIRETVTDKQGRFRFPEVNVANPKRVALVDDPLVVIFKPGYRRGLATSRCWLESNCKATRIAGASGETFRLKRIPEQEFLPDPKHPNRLIPAYGNFDGLYEKAMENCGPVRAPRFFEALEQERTRLSPTGSVSIPGLPGYFAVQKYSIGCNVDTRGK
ncbi:MAG: carboxypeptidase regulatory-like domain-containing protein [Betaproteobacteria bacterium]|nr:carboxypeptidase regulatory-like domain-containing protein [Betaproteobacteria bacterium]